MTINQRIIYSNPDGSVSIITPASSIELALKDVPNGVPHEIISIDNIPPDRFFRNAWTKGTGKIDIDLLKAREIGHEVRRQKRAAEFAPYDEIIAKQIPGKDAIAAEMARQQIRDKYADIQSTIDAAKIPEDIKVALGVTL